MGMRYGRIMRCTRPFGRTFVIALLAVLTSRFRIFAAIQPTPPPRLGEAEAANCDGFVTECKVCDALKQVSLNNRWDLMICRSKCT